jgi:hypothetical protein
MAVYVPVEYLKCEENQDENVKYTCEINSSGKKGDYNVSTVSIVFQVETPSYAAMAAPTSYHYDIVSTYLICLYRYILILKINGYDWL